jgi:hypothetical protein
MNVAIGTAAGATKGIHKWDFRCSVLKKERSKKTVVDLIKATPAVAGYHSNVE